MERLDPQRFAKHNPKTITQREANQFAADLAESIERAVSDPNERKDLFELLSAAMPPAMRRRWDGKERRRVLADVIHDLDVARRAAQAQKAKRRRDLLAQIVSYLPWELISVVAENADLLNLSDPPKGDNSPGATQPTTSTPPNPPLTPEKNRRGLAQFAESSEQFVPVPFSAGGSVRVPDTVLPPRPYSNHSAAEPSPEPLPPNDLPPAPAENRPE
jgi:hypothetical protein